MAKTGNYSEKLNLQISFAFYFFFIEYQLEGYFRPVTYIYVFIDPNDQVENLSIEDNLKG